MRNQSRDPGRTRLSGRDDHRAGELERRRLQQRTLVL